MNFVSVNRVAGFPQGFQKQEQQHQNRRQPEKRQQSQLSDESDTTDELSDDDSHNADWNEVFLQDYFHKQYLRMQSIYPPSFKSKERKSENSLNPALSYQNQWRIITPSISLTASFEEPAAPYVNDQTADIDCRQQYFGDITENKMEMKAAISQKGVDLREGKQYTELSEIILYSLEKLGIVCFNRRR